MVNKDLTLALVAHLNGFLTSEQMVSSFQKWLADPKREFTEYLVQDQVFSRDVMDRLRDFLEVHDSKEPNASGANDFFSLMTSLSAELQRVANEVLGDSVGVNEGLFSATYKSEVQQNRDTVIRNFSVDNRFRIVNLHAEGGLGIVSVALDQQIGRDVALKQIKVQFADNAIHRFKFIQEAEITGQLEHPGIVPIYALGKDSNGRPYYAMKFIHGESMRDAIKSFHEQLATNSVEFDGPELRQLLRRFIDVCNAVEYAHDKGVLHRDLKPQNIMLGKHGETLVVDWGLAKRFDQAGSLSTPSSKDVGESTVHSGDNKTLVGTFLGTPAYAPPEQLKGELEKLSVRSDVYSLGVVLFELLANTIPISGLKNLTEAVEAIESGEISSPKKIKGQVPEGLDFICRQALLADPEKRFSTVAQLKVEVQRWLDDLPIGGMKERLGVKIGRWIRHHQTLATAILLSTALLSLLMLVLVVSARNAAIQDRKLLVAERDLRLQREEATVTNLLNDATMARGRGNFAGAVEMTRRATELKPKESLTTQEILLLARDLFSAEMPIEAAKELTKIDFSNLSAEDQAIYNLVDGDLKIMSTREREGYKQILQAINSGFLNDSDLAYAEGIVAKTYTECVVHLKECIRLDPLNPNAISRLAVSHAFAGELREAQVLVTTGCNLWPADLRFIFVDTLLAAIRGESDRFAKRVQEFREEGGTEAEIAILELIRQGQAEFTELVTNSLQKGSDFKEIGGLLLRFTTLSMKSREGEGFGTMPVLGWLGNAYSQFPGLIDFTTANLTGKHSGYMSRLSVVLPNHDLANTLLGFAYFGESNFSEAASAFTRTLALDSMSDKIRSQTVWMALACINMAAIQRDEAPLDEESLAKVIPFIAEQYQRNGGFEADHFSLDVKFALLLRARMFSYAAKLADQQQKTVEGEAKRQWRQRFELASRYAEEHSKNIRSELDKINSMQ